MEVNSQVICSMKKDNMKWRLFDCDEKEISILPTKANFPSAMNRRYRNKRGKDVEDLSCVWFLVGKSDKGKEWIQVGRNLNLTSMLSRDIKEDIKEVCSGTGRYRKLNEEYKELIFREIDIKDYINNDEEAKKILGKEPTDINLKRAYWVNCASYIEGKLAYENNAKLYHSSALDGCYYAYFKSKKK